MQSGVLALARRSLPRAPASPSPPPPCQLEYPPRPPPDWRGGGGGRTQGKGSAREPVPGLASFGASRDGAVPGSGGTPGTRLRVSRPPPTPTPQPGLGPKKPRKSRLESLDRVKRADIERAKTRFTQPLPSRGKQDFRMFENTVKCVWCEASHPTKVPAKRLKIHMFPKYSPPCACFLSVTLGLEMCGEFFCWPPLESFCFRCWPRSLGCVCARSLTWKSVRGCCNGHRRKQPPAAGHQPCPVWERQAGQSLVSQERGCVRVCRLG